LNVLYCPVDRNLDGGKQDGLEISVGNWCQHSHI